MHGKNPLLTSHVKKITLIEQFETHVVIAYNKSCNRHISDKILIAIKIRRFRFIHCPYYYNYFSVR